MRILADSFPGHIADGNTRVRHPAERGAWIWHPDKEARETAVLRFRLRFQLRSAASALLHVSADQRFQLRCDGRDLSFGPDRGDVDHWTVQSLAVELAAGEHELEALVWYLAPVARLGEGVAPPMAQMTWRGGFLLVGEGLSDPGVDSGAAPWVVEDLTPAVTMRRPALPGYHDIGPEFEFDVARWRGAEAVPAAVIVPPLVGNPHGVRRPGWCLFPADIPEQRREEWRGGRIRAVRPGLEERPWQESGAPSPDAVKWTAWLRGEQAITVPPRSRITLLWDMEDYVCGYPNLRLEGGAGGRVGWAWSEGLYEEERAERVRDGAHKGHRDVIAGKVFVGIEDRWGSRASFEGAVPALWWRSGRYVRLRIETEGEALALHPPRVLTTGYPLERVGSWSSSEPRWDALMPVFERSLRRAAHELWVDTPYYEQLGYVGDNVLMALHNYAWFGDARLSRRALELFDWSRAGGGGLVAERYPSSWRQESATFSLLWPGMVRDYAWWRDDKDFVRARLPGVRTVLAEFDAMTDGRGLLGRVPGWPFVDWAREWNEGCGPGVREGDSSIVNLHHVLALQAAAQIESAVGRAEFADVYGRQARHVFDAILERYWDGGLGALLDTRGGAGAVLSEHAQALALRTGLLDATRTRSCLAFLRSPRPGVVRASIYGAFQVLDALYRNGDEAEFHRRLEVWNGLRDAGLLCTPEQPEPTRSDAHAWGAHPAWHSLASIAGVRPAAPFFSQVKIAPCLGALTEVRCAVAHPAGSIRVHLVLEPGTQTLTAEVALPSGVSGILEWHGMSSPLAPGENLRRLSPSAPSR